jgi:hypothetical protein
MSLDLCIIVAIIVIGGAVAAAKDNIKCIQPKEDKKGDGFPVIYHSFFD